ncbi:MULTISPECIES: TRAP transporter small permease [unclassified Polynucleobacter]|jgi:TRAP-type C4-dicarboxylate transport system permease small subunit|uniref:TRAP transporter small permease n=1 Tax=unclassified Polynucleobacter TaxID=2640945 RepID=UPI001BFE9223|nr:MULTISPECIES: TRAP transporter small permease [unclassified Polynucleobacter]MBU3605290.1 TRAP transporter small permease [Polynucleobacter sp. MWH-Creno-3A4]QWD77482.1 TRAP transporter small permease [Polynucleobacter sp. MWH-Svant-W18]
MTQLLQATDRFMSGLNKLMVLFGSLALVAASVILSYSVASRAFFGATTDWQDEAAVFCLVGATFLCGAYVQEIRGHVGISAISTMLPRSINRVRILLIDIASCAFCAFFAWKSWALFHEAWIDGQVTSSSWAPPLWIPYIMMSIGMSLLAFQILLQAFGDVSNPGKGE